MCIKFYFFNPTLKDLEVFVQLIPKNATLEVLKDLVQKMPENSIESFENLVSKNS